MGACALAALVLPSAAFGKTEVQDVQISVNGGPWGLVANDRGDPNGYVQVLPGDVLDVQVI